MAVVTRNLLLVVEPRRRARRDRRPTGLGLDAGGSATLTPARTLTLVALATLRRARNAGDRPASWATPRFGREVDLIRLHLAPIRSRLGLAASFGREAFHADPMAEAGAPGPVTAAYTIRWLELGDGERRPPWPDWLDGAETAA
jgi:hypothetical protein